MLHYANQFVFIKNNYKDILPIKQFVRLKRQIHGYISTINPLICFYQLPN